MSRRGPHPAPSPRAALALVLGLAVAPSAWAAAAGGDTDYDGASDASDAFPCDWRRSAVTFLPSEREFSTLMFEDNWPARGDLDFNDGVVLHQAAFFRDVSGGVTGVRLVIVARAVGAKISSGLAVRLPFPASSVRSIVRTVAGGSPTALNVLAEETDLVVPVSTSLHEFFDATEGFINTDPAALNRGDGPTVVVDIELAGALPLALSSDPVDLYFFRTEDPRHQIHRPEFTGTDTMNQALFNTQDDASSGSRAFVDTDGLPFVLSLPAETSWPRERVAVDALWPEIVVFAASGGAEARDFYGTNLNAAAAYPTPFPVSALPLDYAACFAPTCTDGARNGTETDVDCGGGCGPCGTGGGCRVHDDCATGVCLASTCVQADVRACSVANGSGEQTRASDGWAACVATTCNGAYHVEAGACASDTRACAAPHGTGSQTWSGAWGACVPSACDAGHHLEGGACTNDTRSCAIANGTGSQTWSGAGYGACTLVGCDAGYRSSNGGCALVTYAWTTGAWGTCSGGSASPAYGAWGACTGGSGAWSYGAWGTCSASSVCSGAGSQSRSASCAFTAASGSQSRSASCAWDGNSGSQSRTATCVDDVGNPVADALCSGAAPATTQACTPAGSPSSCGTVVTTQSCTPSDSSVCGSAQTTQACSSPAGSRSCSVGNGAGSQSCAAGATTWDACTITGCNPGFHEEAGACVSDTRSCAIANGTGSQTWSGGWGACTLTGCNSGYRASGGACVLLTYAWSAGAWGTCTGGAAVQNYGAWGTCQNGTAAYNYGNWGSCSVSAVCSGTGTQSRSASCVANAGSGTQSRTGDCAWTASSGSQSRSVTCVDNFGQPASSALCSGSAPGSTQSCTPPATPASCGTLVTSQACTPADVTGLCGTAVTSQSCSSPSGSRSCTITNGSGTQTCAAGATSWGTCGASSCNTGFHVESGACAADTRACTTASGAAGTQQWVSGAWNTCASLSSCETLRAAYAALGQTLTSGTYSVDPDGGGALAPIGVYCDMSYDGGGWTLVMQVINAYHATTAAVRANDLPTRTTHAKLDDAYIRAFAAAAGLYQAFINEASTDYVIRYSAAEWSNYSSTGNTNVAFDARNSAGVWSNNVCNGHYNNRGFSTYSDAAGAACAVRARGPARYTTSWHTLNYAGGVGGTFAVYVR